MKPFEFERGASSKTMKPFKDIEVINKKEIKYTKARNTEQILEQAEKPLQLDFSNTNIDIKQIMKGVKESAKQIGKTKQLKSVGDLDKLWNKNAFESEGLTSSDIDKILPRDNVLVAVKNVGKNKNKNINVLIDNLSYGGKNINRNKLGQGNLNIPVQAQPPMQTTKQVEQQIQKLKQLQVNANVSPNIPVPTIPKIRIPKFTLPSKKIPTLKLRGKKLSKEAKIRTPKYTSSLLNAAAQIKPLKVTKEQYKRLSRATYTGAEFRPVLEIVPEKKITKVNF
jgi:hypothetical protein